MIIFILILSLTEIETRGLSGAEVRNPTTSTPLSLRIAEKSRNELNLEQRFRLKK